MEELAGRLTALDPDAGVAVRVIAYFDRLAESRAGLEALVRGAAVLSGCPARLVDEPRRVRIRVEPDGARRDTDTAPDAAWPHEPLIPGAAAVHAPAALWLERDGGAPSVVDAVILERAAGVIRHVLDRTRGRAPAEDSALIETLLDPTADEHARLLAAKPLGLDAADPKALFRAVAVYGGRPRVLPADAVQPDAPNSPNLPNLPGPENIPPARLGVGPAVPVLELPHSWSAARTALRFTAAGTPQDPGARIVHADELGDLALLGKLVVPGAELPADVRALEAAIADAPWTLVTLHAVATTPSLRAAAAEINVHHSTLQARIAHAETLLGWSIHTPQGLLRLHLALTMRHLALTAGISGT
jgi:PucR C-terminal helix-turn-helix domain